MYCRMTTAGNRIRWWTQFYFNFFFTLFFVVEDAFDGFSILSFFKILYAKYTIFIQISLQIIKPKSLNIKKLSNYEWMFVGESSLSVMNTVS